MQATICDAVSELVQNACESGAAAVRLEMVRRASAIRSSSPRNARYALATCAISPMLAARLAASVAR